MLMHLKDSLVAYSATELIHLAEYSSTRCRILPRNDGNKTRKVSHVLRDNIFLSVIGRQEQRVWRPAGLSPRAILLTPG